MCNKREIECYNKDSCEICDEAYKQGKEEKCDKCDYFISVEEAYKQGGTDAINELTNALIDEIQCKPYMCLDSKDIREIAKNLKENKE